MEIRAKDIFLIVLLWLLITDLAVIFDIPGARQVLGFLLLTILPGALLLQVLRVQGIGTAGYATLSVGISIGLAMLFGLLQNNLFLLLGHSRPLSTIPLLASINLFLIVLAIAGYALNRTTTRQLTGPRLTPDEIRFLIPPVVFPALVVLGMHLMNTAGSNHLLIAVFVLIALYVAAVSFMHRKFSGRLYPAVILLISISLLLVLALRSGHIIGTDTHFEYYTFVNVRDSMHWSIAEPSLLDACLSISLLPAIYHAVLNVPAEFLFKTLYAVLYSISPLIVFVIARRYLDDVFAFLAALFFMFQPQFLSAAANARTYLAVLFFMLFVMILFSEIGARAKKALLVICMASAVVSHYTTSYIFFAILAATWLVMAVVSRRYRVEAYVTLDLLAIFLALQYIWYVQVTVLPGEYFVNFIRTTYHNLDQVFVSGIRGSDVQTAFGYGIGEGGIPHIIQFWFTWLTLALVVAGMLALIGSYAGMTGRAGARLPGFMRRPFEVAYTVMAFVCMGLLAATVIFPTLSVGYEISRIYPVVLSVLSVFFVIGGIRAARSLHSFAGRTGSRKIATPGGGNPGMPAKIVLIFILAVLLPHFLCSTGVVHTAFGVSRDITLHAEGEQYDTRFVHQTDRNAALWVRDTLPPEGIVLGDAYGHGVLLSQGHVSPKRLGVIREKEDIPEGIVFMRYTNVVTGRFLDGNVQWVDTEEYADLLHAQRLIYSNGGSVVWLPAGDYESRIIM
ncbi:MAG: DUF2206 domain-containing protein [Methanomicrobiaceae archaeon]|nr:DUF2206 domain-containing protein [Methanomicrobiaceae archaeon]MDD5419161.1 DUF2206 domain-containing protein [Methanomicrobiaceae archaeon]